MDEILDLLGKRISSLRQKRGLTQEKLAELTGYSPNHISKLESSRTKPSFDLLVCIAKALQINIKELFNFDEYTDKKKMINELQSYITHANNQQIELLYKIYNSLNS
ncbi:MAG: helix-turn-helix domain-containing protein [bacterium]|nr:helix-turn-helix domain-containing protein [bacterium]